MNAVPAGVNAAAFLETIKQDLIGKLIFDSIEARAPKLFSIFQLFGFVVHEEALGTLDRQAHDKEYISFDKIKAFFDAPLLYLQSEFKQLDSGLDYADILGKTLDLAKAFGLAPLYLDGDQLASVQFDTYESAPPALPTLALNWRKTQPARSNFR